MIKKKLFDCGALIFIFGVLLGLLISFTAGCSEQTIAHNYGGSMDINLPEGQKMELITWKEDSLWILTRPMRDEEEPENYIYKEYSPFGIIEGEVKIFEKEGR